MTVAELILALEALPQEAVVIVISGDPDEVELAYDIDQFCIDPSNLSTAFHDRRKPFPPSWVPAIRII